MKKVALAVMVAAAVLGGCKRGEKAVETGTQGSSRGGATTTAAKTSTAPAATATGTEVGAMMPEYSAMWLDGSKFEMESKKGKVVLLNLWATWCGPCRFEIPELQAIHDRYAAKNFEVVGVSVDESGVESVRDFVKEHEMTYPVVLDAEGKLANVFQTSVLPTSVIIDRNGKIVWKKFGAIMPDDQELKKAIESSL
jgi:cytochrome c biogenesis protein CcmG, thiol:disulfide interchange protein DsbE